MELFIYTPKTGSKILNYVLPAEGPIALVTWANRSHHIYGDGVHLAYWCAEARSHVRQAACAVASALVDATGGVAWDDRGMVHLVVPRQAAGAAHDTMLAVGPVEASQRYGRGLTPNEAGLVAAGCVRMAWKSVTESLVLGERIAGGYQEVEKCWRNFPMPQHKGEAPCEHWPRLAGETEEELCSREEEPTLHDA